MGVEVFSEVTAIISPSISSSIIGCAEDTLKQCIYPANIEKVTSDTDVRYSLSGTLESIVCAERKLKELIRSTESSNSISILNADDKSNLLFDINTLCHHDGEIQSDESNAITTTCDDTEVINVAYFSASTQMIRRFQKMKRIKLRDKDFYGPKCGDIHTAHPYRACCPKKDTDSDLLVKNLKKMKLNIDRIELNTDNNEIKCSQSDPDSSDDKGTLTENNNCEADSPYKYSCSICSFKSKRTSHFNKHMSIHKKSDTLFKCTQCTFTAVRLSHLRRHEVTHSDVLYNCSQCRYRTDNGVLLLRHARLKHRKSHGGKKPSVVLNCSFCSYHTTKSSNFRKHQQGHGLKDKSVLYNCEACSYKTYRKEHYTRHANSVHSNKRPFLCQLCGKSFKRGDSLQMHQQTHPETKTTSCNYKCNTCEKAFQCHSHLVEHKAVHSGDRAFLCEVCGAAFKTRSVQRKHVSTIHNNPFVFPCTLCEKTFSTLYACRRHQKVHISKGDIMNTNPEGSSKIFDTVAETTTDANLNESSDSTTLVELAPMSEDTLVADVEALALHDPAEKPASENVSEVAAISLQPKVLSSTENPSIMTIYVHNGNNVL